ncbi:MAG: rubredoxin-like domain-containing protein [Planctomycetota bacterium]
MHQSFVYCGTCGYRRSGSAIPERCPICGAWGDKFQHVLPNCPPHHFGEQAMTGPVVPLVLIEEGAVIGDLLREYPTLAVVFASWGVDLAAATSLTIAQAAEDADIDLRKLIAELNELLCSPSGA